MTGSATLTILGSCSGTEPMPGRHHTSLVLNHGDRLYWFDAGETCSYTAHLAGVDLPATEAVFISHTHMDHIGGLPNLLWTLNKLTRVSAAAKQRLQDRTLDIFLPDLQVWEGIDRLLAGTEGGFRTPFRLRARRYADGVVYERAGVRVRALHNRHLGDSSPFLSFSFRIELQDSGPEEDAAPGGPGTDPADGGLEGGEASGDVGGGLLPRKRAGGAKTALRAGIHRIVYSGDVKSIEDCAPLLEDCDLLLMETGHHRVEDVCAWLRDEGRRPGRLVFVHHGRAILEDRARELAKARAILGDDVAIAEDGMVIHL